MNFRQYVLNEADRDLRKINVKKSNVITQKNADDWGDTHQDKNGFLKSTEGYFSNSPDFKVYDFVVLRSIRSTDARPFYGVEHGKYNGSFYTYFIPASDVVFEDE